ncbi:MAG TPA: hypothetical protein VFZ53_21190 [Polyangiaceae bacterium]
MASSRSLQKLAFGLFLTFAGCASGTQRYPLKAPLARDTDLRTVSVPCVTSPTEDDPEHVTCAPEPYESPLAWDAVDNSVFRPLARVFAVDPAGAAVNVNAFDEVPDSAWFTNRLGARRPSEDELLSGACSAEELLDPSSAAPGSYRIDQGKTNGATPGFRIRVGKRKYMLKTDVREQPERPSAASAIGAAIYHAVGFNTSCEQIVYLDRSVLDLAPGLTVKDNTGVEKPFDESALEKVLAQATPRGRLLRFQASAWLPGHLLGPFRYEGTRSDDPNDVIAHEDRRELRGGRVLAAWLNHFDAREQNTMDTWIASGSGAKDASPGFVRHYYLDTSDSFGSEWAWDGVSRRLGRSYLLDFEDIGLDFVTLGTHTAAWEKAERTPGFEAFGYYHYRDFDPEAWKNEYPNPAFTRATEHDNAWMARILSRFERADIDALVSLGKFSRPEYSAFLAKVLEERLRRIVERYLTRLSPLADLRIEGKNRLCAVDLLRRRAARPERAFRYAARLHEERGSRAVPVAGQAAGRVCVTLPREDAATSPRYRVVVVSNGAARYPLVAHLYDLGSKAGYRLVGIERPENEAVDLAHVGFEEN